ALFLFFSPQEGHMQGNMRRRIERGLTAILVAKVFLQRMRFIVNRRRRNYRDEILFPVFFFYCHKGTVKSEPVNSRASSNRFIKPTAAPGVHKGRQRILYRSNPSTAIGNRNYGGVTFYARTKHDVNLCASITSATPQYHGIRLRWIKDSLQ